MHMLWRFLTPCDQNIKIIEIDAYDVITSEIYCVVLRALYVRTTLVIFAFLAS